MPRNKFNKLLIGLTGIVAFVLLLNLILALFYLYRANERHVSNINRLSEMMQALEAARTAQVHFKKQVQEWKNILLRGQNSEDLKKYLDGFNSDERAVQAELQKLEALSQKIGLDHAAIQTVLQTHKALGEHYRSALKAYIGKDPQTIFVVDRMVRGIDRAPTDAMDTIVQRIWEYEKQLIVQIQKETESQYAASRNLLIPVTVIGVFLVFVLLWLSFSQSRD